jgi:hypothetical protein
MVICDPPTYDHLEAPEPIYAKNGTVDNALEGTKPGKVHQV